MGIVVIGVAYVDIKGYSSQVYIPAGRNAGTIIQSHGGVGRNVVEDIANVELRPTFVGLADDNAMGSEVINKLNNHKVDTRYMRRVPNGMGTWLAVFDHKGDVVASISQRPDLTPILGILEEHGDEIFQNADSIVVEIDIDPEIIKKVFRLAEKYEKKVYALVSNMTIAVERRDLLQKSACFVCNQQEAGIYFYEDYEEKTPEEMVPILSEKIRNAGLHQMVITMGANGAVYADENGDCGICPAMRVNVIDTTGAGDAFFSGVCMGLTYGKTLGEACRIGTRLSASVISTTESVCPRFLPEEFGLNNKIYNEQRLYGPRSKT